MAARLLLLVLLALGACAETTYGPYEGAAEPIPFIERRVAFHVDRAFHRDPPLCAIVLPLTAAPSPRIAALVEESLARHLAQRLPRIIGPLERRRRARDLGLDLANAADRSALAKEADCPAFVESGLYDAGEDFLLVWARRSLGLEVRMTWSRDATVLWRARHQGMRAEGGFPLSPLSAAFSGVSAARFYDDEDVTPSLVDDVVRRTVASLPDVR